MSQYQITPHGKDPELWEIAKKKASFKTHAMTYLIVNLFLWGIWYLTKHELNKDEIDLFPWPLWTSVCWGIGLAFHYAGAYVYPKQNSVEREYDKLKSQQKTY